MGTIFKLNEKEKIIHKNLLDCIRSSVLKKIYDFGYLYQKIKFKMKDIESWYNRKQIKIKKSIKKNVGSLKRLAKLNQLIARLSKINK